MSDEDTVDDSDSQLLTAEFKDGQLQIVEVTPYEKSDNEGGTSDEHMLPDMIREGGGGDQAKFMQVLDPDKGLVQLDLLNLTLVRCDDAEESYRLVANTDSKSSDEMAATETVTCVLQSDGEEQDPQDSYVMVEGEEGPIMFVKSSLPQTNMQQHKKIEMEKPSLSPSEILERAKALQKAKALMAESQSGRGRGRKRKGDLPPPHELLSSPNFKLFLYSCKMCPFKCNAIKELTAHKAAEHGGATGKWRGGGGGRAAAATLQCARCPFRGGSHSQLMKHVQEKHMTSDTSSDCTPLVDLNSAEADAADVLVCGACGFESSSRPVFKKHIEEVHHAKTS